MAKRFLMAFVAFIFLVVPTSFGLALLAAPAKPAPVEPRPGCDQTLAGAMADIAAVQARMKNLSTASSAEACTATRLYFLEMVKVRAVTALCKSGPERDRDLGRLDADVEHINETIAARCG